MADAATPRADPVPVRFVRGGGQREVVAANSFAPFRRGPGLPRESHTATNQLRTESHTATNPAPHRNLHRIKSAESCNSNPAIYFR